MPTQLGKFEHQFDLGEQFTGKVAPRVFVAAITRGLITPIAVPTPTEHVAACCGDPQFVQEGSDLRCGEKGSCCLAQRPSLHSYGVATNGAALQRHLHGVGGRAKAVRLRLLSRPTESDLHAADAVKPPGSMGSTAMPDANVRCGALPSSRSRRKAAFVLRLARAAEDAQHVPSAGSRRPRYPRVSQTQLGFQASQNTHVLVSRLRLIGFLWRSPSGPSFRRRPRRRLPAFTIRALARAYGCRTRKSSFPPT